MNVGRFSVEGEDRVGVFETEMVYDVTPGVGSFNAALETLCGGATLGYSDAESYAVEEVHYLPPTTPTNTVFAIALNYRSHIDEGYETNVPEWPWIFLKPYRSLIGHRDPIEYDTSVTTQIDYEAELAAVIGRPARHIDPADALECVAGYTILNDISARDIQRVQVGDSEYLDWFSGKALQSSTPVGPFVATADALPAPDELHIESRLNGELMQDEGTGLMIRDVAELVAFVSTRVRLEPGDVIATGTPEGVGLYQDITLADGDEVTITIDGIGTLSNVVSER